MSSWRTVALGKLAKVASGFAFKSSEFQETGIPVIKIKNVRVGDVDLSDADFVDERNLSLPPRYRAREGDILVSLTGSHLTQPNSVVGRVARLRGVQRPCLINQRVGKFVIGDESECLPDYLFHALRSPETTHAIAMMAHGAASQANVSPTQVESLAIGLPPLDIQRRIASILGAYDDLIEVNRRRVAVLEEMARGLFEEWFVRFHFPGHEAVSIIDTVDGPLPEGWDWCSVGEVASYVNRGIAPKYDEESATLVISQKCIRDHRLSFQPARRQSKSPPPPKIVQEGDVLINSTGVGTLGRVAQAEGVPEGLTVDSHVTIVRPSGPADRDYLGLTLLRLQPVFELLGAGSTGQTELSRGAVEAQTLIWAPIDLREHFGRIVRPMRTLASQLLNQNELLAASRDLLLPRLISGQLSVEAAEQVLEDAA